MFGGWSMLDSIDRIQYQGCSTKLTASDTPTKEGTPRRFKRLAIYFFKRQHWTKHCTNLFSVGFFSNFSFLVRWYVVNCEDLLNFQQGNVSVIYAPIFVRGSIRKVCLPPVS